MKRSEFLRLGLLAAIAAGTGVVNLPEFKPQPRIIVNKGRWRCSFKVSKELLEDQEQFDKLLQEMTKREPVPEHYELTKVDIGWDGDDFTKNLYTCVMTYNHT